MEKYIKFLSLKGPDDADYVQVVHTDAFARGILSSSGHQGNDTKNGKQTLLTSLNYFP